jgi:3-hydroxyisobutyrate dehydrogenase-like beta-hydroxyacid dehydrogenase
MSDKQTVGFIGVGLMGHGMAKNILEKGYPLVVLGHRNRGPVDDLVSRGATEAENPAALAAAVEVLFLCVSNSQVVESLVLGESGIAAGAREGLIVVDCSTADPTSTLKLQTTLADQGVTLIDAPLGNTPREAELGQLNAFVGSDDETLEKVRPIIDTWAQTIVHVGPVGTGHKAKLINNFVALSYNAVYAEAFAACRKSGVDVERFRDIIAAGGLNCGLFQRITNYVVGGDPEAHLFTLVNCYKDIRYFNRLADDAGIVAAMGSAAKDYYAMAMANGGDSDSQHMPMLTDFVYKLNGVSDS